MHLATLMCLVAGHIKSISILFFFYMHLQVFCKSRIDGVLSVFLSQCIFLFCSWMLESFPIALCYSSSSLFNWLLGQSGEFAVLSLLSSSLRSLVSTASLTFGISNLFFLILFSSLIIVTISLWVLFSLWSVSSACLLLVSSLVFSFFLREAEMSLISHLFPLCSCFACFSQVCARAQSRLIYMVSTMG